MNNSKQLHKHALPIVTLSIGLLMGSFMLMSSLLLHGQSVVDTSMKMLVSRGYNFAPTNNGLVHITKNQIFTDQTAEAVKVTGTKTIDAAALEQNGQMVGVHIQFDLATKQTK